MIETAYVFVGVIFDLVAAGHLSGATNVDVKNDSIDGHN